MSNTAADKSIAVNIRMPASLRERVYAALGEEEKAGAFIRTAIRRELERREKGAGK